MVGSEDEYAMCKENGSELFTGFRMLSPEVVAFYKKKSTIFLNKQFYVGLAILDLSRYIIYSDLYLCFKPALSNPRCIYHDTGT